jgi:membrane protein
VRRLVQPYVKQHLAENAALAEAVDKVFGFVGATNVSGLGVVGLVFLGYSALSLLASVESVLNDIWDVQRGRRLFRRFTDYVTMAVTTPLLVLAAVTLGTAAQSSGLVGVLRHRLGLGGIIDLGLRFTSLAGTCLAMTAVMLVMPNTHVRAASGLIGGVTAAILWQLALALEVHLQVGVANYNALYSGFAALPVFLVWVYASWLTVLVGAEVAASYQNEQRATQRRRARRANDAVREAVGLAVAVRLARVFQEGAPRPSTADLAADLAAPLPLVEQAADRLARSGILVATQAGDEHVFALGQAPHHVTAWDVITTLRGAGGAGGRDLEVQLQLDPRVLDVLEGLARAASESRSNLTLAALVTPPSKVGDGPH